LKEKKKRLIILPRPGLCTISIDGTEHEGNDQTIETGIFSARISGSEWAYL
jgi:hypothetical protein